MRGINDSEERRPIWMRVGVSLDCTAEEAEVIMSGEGADLISEMIYEGRFSLDGDAYVPDSVVEEYDAEYGTNYGAYGADEIAYSL